jgi:ATP-dependent RNA helicase DDX47/RRP3
VERLQHCDTKLAGIISRYAPAFSLSYPLHLPELAQQISKVIEALGALISVHCTLLIRGSDMISRAISLVKKPHVIISTPGQLLDLENTKEFSLLQLKYLVLDKVDKLLELDFGPVLDKLLGILPWQTTYLYNHVQQS